MQLRNVLIIYGKELTDFLRDRRTILSLIIAPLLVMPIFMLGMVYFVSRSQQAAKQKHFVVGLKEDAAVEGLRASLEKADFETRSEPDPRRAVETKAVDIGIESLRSGGKVVLKIYMEGQMDMEVTVAKNRLERTLDQLKDDQVKAALKKAGVSETVLEPFSVEKVNMTPPRKMAGSFLGASLGFMIVVFMLSGGMYPAIDMTAGEKERRTMEMLLASAATREEIVVGKLLATLSLTMATAVLSVLSFAGSFFYTRRMGGPGGAFANIPGLPLLDAGTLLLLLLSTVPMAVLAAAITLAVAVSARSHKEAASYVTPMLFAGMFLGMATVLPGVKWNSGAWFLPVANFNQIVKDLLLGDWSWLAFASTLGANTLYAAAAVAAALRNFRNERILFRT